jgi:hypothetical protein
MYSFHFVTLIRDSWGNERPLQSQMSLGVHGYPYCALILTLPALLGKGAKIPSELRRWTLRAGSIGEGAGQP